MKKNWTKKIELYKSFRLKTLVREMSEGRSNSEYTGIEQQSHESLAAPEDTKIIKDTDSRDIIKE